MAIAYYHNFSLFMAHFSTILCVALLLFLICKYEEVMFIIIAVVFSVVINIYLKSVWQVPLNPLLGKVGWAYPSGHTQNAVVFWLMAAYVFRKSQATMLISLLLLNNFNSMTYFGYHTWDEIMGAVNVSLIYLAMLYYVYQHIKDDINAYYRFSYLIIIASLLLIELLPHQIMNYAWMWKLIAIEGVIAFIFLGNILYNNKYKGQNLFELMDRRCYR